MMLEHTPGSILYIEHLMVLPLALGKTEKKSKNSNPTRFPNVLCDLEIIAKTENFEIRFIRVMLHNLAYCSFESQL